jgi:hypothetical protein
MLQPLQIAEAIAQDGGKSLTLRQPPQQIRRGFEPASSELGTEYFKYLTLLCRE